MIFFRNKLFYLIDEHVLKNEIFQNILVLIPKYQMVQRVDEWVSEGIERKQRKRVRYC